MQHSPSDSLIATIAKNRAEEVRVRLNEYHGSHFVDLRQFVALGDDTERKPTKKGISLRLDKLDELAAAIAQARVEAERLGLLEAS